MVNLVIVHQNIQKEVIILNSLQKNDNIVFSINDNSTEQDVLDFLNSETITNNIIDNLAFIYHYPGYNSLPFFYDIPIYPEEGTEPETEPEPLIFKKPTYRHFSDNTVSLINSLKSSYSLQNIDILTCSLNDQHFKDEIITISDDLGISINYSFNDTGNSVDWVLESNGVDIKDTYFNDEIDNWNGLLTGSVPLSNVSSITGNILVISVNNGITTYTLPRVVTITELNSIYGGDGFYFSIGNNEVFDGAGHTVDFDGSSTGGLFASTGDSPVSIPLIKNLGVVNGLLNGYGTAFIVRYGQKYINVDNCYNTSNIGVFSYFNNKHISSGGGIVGFKVANNGGICNITNCYNTGNMYGYSGGIVANGAANLNGVCNVTNCYNTGHMYNNTNAGIIAANSGNFGECNVENCYNTGFIMGNRSGGIYGSSVGTGGIANVINCYNTGDIYGNESGGIYGYLSGYMEGICKVTNCYNTGINNGNLSGSIAGNRPNIIQLNTYGNRTHLYYYTQGDLDFRDAIYSIELLNKDNYDNNRFDSSSNFITINTDNNNDIVPILKLEDTSYNIDNKFIIGWYGNQLLNTGQTINIPELSNNVLKLIDKNTPDIEQDTENKRYFYIYELINLSINVVGVPVIITENSRIIKVDNITYQTGDIIELNNARFYIGSRNIIGNELKIEIDKEEPEPIFVTNLKNLSVENTTLENIVTEVNTLKTTLSNLQDTDTIFEIKTSDLTLPQPETPSFREIRKNILNEVLGEVQGNTIIQASAETLGLPGNVNRYTLFTIIKDVLPENQLRRIDITNGTFHIFDPEPGIILFTIEEQDHIFEINQDKTQFTYIVDENDRTKDQVFNIGDTIDIETKNIIFGSFIITDNIIKVFEVTSNKNITFILNDIDLFGTLSVPATVEEGTTSSNITGDLILEGSISAGSVHNIFRFQTDATSIDDISSTDLKFKQLFGYNNNILVNSIVSSKTIVTENTIPGTSRKDIISKDLLLSQEYVQYIALNVFGTRKGADIFDNETELRDELITDMRNSFTKFFTDNSYNDSEYNEKSTECVNITQKLFQTIMRLDGSRIDLSGGSIEDIEDFQAVPLRVGDVLVMKYTVKDNNTHANDLTNNNWIANNSERSYIIKLNIV